jgi:glycosyltransferase involved in cell wall biosynthesis
VTDTPLRLLFVSGASTGGAFRSSLELAEALERRGHSTAVLIETGGSRRRRLAKRLLDFEVRLGGGRISRLLASVRRPLGSPVPENAVPAVVREISAEAVIVSSIRRPAWRAIRNWCRGRGVLSVLYMRGVSELDQLDHPDGRPDLLLSNTSSVAETARRRGHTVTFIPSLVDLSRSATETTRTVALLVSPTELQGVDTALELAAARPDVTFALQQSWDLGTDEARRLQDRLTGLPNVELRPRTERPAEIYRDARVLLAPHRIDNRPRVVLEAQANGIPVIATAHPGIVDQMGDGGIAVAPGAGTDAWLSAFSSLWDDQANYDHLTVRARLWARRPEQDENALVDRFVTVLRSALAIESPRTLQEPDDQPMER